MKVSIYIVVCNWSGLEKHNREFVEWFLDEREAYNKALDLANDSDGTHKYYILIGEREMNIKKKKKHTMKSPKNLKIIFQIRFGRRTFLNLATSEVHSFWFVPAGLTFSKKAGSWMFVAGVLMFRLSVIHYYQDKPEEEPRPAIGYNASIKRVCRRKRR